VAWVKWKLILVHLEILLISTQDWCTVCVERATGSEIILGALDGTPRYVGLVEARFDPFGDSVPWPKIDARFASNVPRAWKSFWPHPGDLLGGMGQMESHFGPFRDCVNLDA
jgi:hypothetical protein